MQEVQLPLRSGVRALVRDQSWLVIDVEQFADATLVTLRGMDQTNNGRISRVIAPFDRVAVMRPRTEILSRSRCRVLQTAAAAAAEAVRWRDVWVAASADIEIRPWQLEPVRAVLGGACRLLLADEVGLGKTIQALLVACELGLRGLAHRTLVLTPAGLRDQWAAELSTRFAGTPTVYDTTTLADTVRAMPPGVNPWAIAPVVVTSIDLVKRAEVRAALDAVAFDVLIVDEAHHLTPASDRGAVVADLAARTPWVVLVTGTPHSGDEPAYRFLRSLGAAGDKDLVTFRRTRAGVRGPVTRREHVLAVAPTPMERRLLDATLAYTRALWRGAPGPGARLVATVIARRAASSAAAARDTLARRLALMGGDPAPHHQDRLPWDEEIDDHLEELDEALGTHGLADVGHERAWLDQLTRLAAEASPASSKVRVLRTLLRRTAEPLIVFSEYRDVADEVAVRIADVSSVGLLHGGLSAADRREVIRHFIEGRVRTLAATDAAGEGLNLQQRCRLVVNLEVPWNPTRLDQRIGRLDRLGQARRVHAINLVHHDSYEDVVLGALARRRTRAGTDFYGGVPTATEQIVAEAVFEHRGVDHGPRRAVEMSHANEPVEPRSSVSLSAQRYALTPGRRVPGTPEGAACVYAARAPREPSLQVLLLFTSDVVDARGRLVERAAVPVEAALTREARRGLSRSTVRGLAFDPRVLDAVNQALRIRVADACEASERFAQAFRDRLRAVRAGIEQRAGSAWFQGSLFDRRVEHAHRASRAARAALLEHLDRHLEGLQALTCLGSTPPHLRAAWLWHRAHSSEAPGVSGPASFRRRRDRGARRTGPRPRTQRSTCC